VNRRLGPILIWTGYAVTALWAVALRLSLEYWHGPRPLILRPFAFGLGLIAANGIAAALALRIRRDYPPEARMHGAWTLIGAGAAAAVLRYGLMLAPFAGMERRPPLMMASQAANVIEYLLLLAGLLRMRASFAEFGLGRLRRVDWAVMAVMALTVPLLFAARDATPGVPFRTPVLIALQRFDPVLIAACAIASVVLYRVSRDLESGLLAVSMRYIAVMAVFRFAALLATMPWFSGIDWLRTTFTAASIGSDWLLTLVVFYRWRLIRQAEEMMGRLKVRS
jgi:hypothetical protein